MIIILIHRGTAFLFFFFIYAKRIKSKIVTTAIIKVMMWNHLVVFMKTVPIFYNLHPS